MFKTLELELYIQSYLLTAEDCGTLTHPTNGQVSYTAGTTYQQTATYSCDPGYNLVGDSTRICHATGMWSGNAPTCHGMLLLELEYYACIHRYCWSTYQLHPKVQKLMIMSSDWISTAFSCLAT